MISWNAFHLPLKTPLKTKLSPPNDASHSVDEILIWDNETTTSRISGLLIAFSLRHHSAISAICSVMRKYQL